MAMNYSKTMRLAVTLIKAGSVPYIEGPPGIGKTAMGKLIAADLGLPLAWCCPNNEEAHELTGALCPVGDNVRKLFSADSPLFRATKEAVLLAFDEFNTITASRFAPVAKVMNERLLGDIPLHPGTKIICFSNSQAQSLDGTDLPLPLLNRKAKIELSYTVEDFQRFLTTYGPVDSPERRFAEQLVGFLEYSPGLLEIDPSKLGPEQSQSFVADIVATNGTWASPRAWERMICFMAELSQNSSPEVIEMLQGDGAVECAASVIGPRQAAAYVLLRGRVKLLPSVQEIADSPLTCKLPRDNAVGITLAAMLPAIAKRNPESAWLYVGRFSGDPAFIGGAECAAQLYRGLTKHCPLSDTASPAAKKIRVQLAAKAKTF